MLDANLELSDGQAVTETAVSTNIFDFGAANPNSGYGGWRTRAQVGTVFASGTSIEAAFQESSDNSTWDDKDRSDVWTAAEAVAGKILHDIGLPAEHLRYVRYNYVVVGTFTTGTVSAYLYTVK